jgi:hypothetical protein
VDLDAHTSTSRAGNAARRDAGGALAGVLVVSRIGPWLAVSG